MKLKGDFLGYFLKFFYKKVWFFSFFLVFTYFLCGLFLFSDFMKINKRFLGYFLKFSYKIVGKN